MDSSIVLEEAVEEGNLYTSAVAEVWIYLSTSVHRGASGRIGAHRGASGRKSLIGSGRVTPLRRNVYVRKRSGG